jgi:hypothetical protein
VEVGSRQSVGLAVSAPLCLRERLALGTVAVAARVGGRALDATVPALVPMAPEFRGATDPDRGGKRGPQGVEACAMLQLGGGLGAGGHPLRTEEGHGVGAGLAWKPPGRGALQRPIGPQFGP